MTANFGSTAPDSSRSPLREVDIAGWLREGWRLYKKEPLVFSLSTAIMGLCLAISTAIPLGPFLLAGPLSVGYFAVIADQAAGRAFAPARLFAGIGVFFSALAAHFIITFFTTVGLVFFILPGLIIYSWYLLTFIFLGDREMGFWEAMEASRKTARIDKTGFFLFYLSLIAVNILGAFCLLIGLLVSIPVSASAVFAAYRDLAVFSNTKMSLKGGGG